MKEVDLVLQVFFVWKYYLEYFLNLIYNHKKEFYSYNKYKNDKNLDNELLIQFIYVLISLITVNIVVYVFDEFQIISFNVHYIINNILMIVSYCLIVLFFILYAILLNLLVLKKISKNIFKMTLIKTIKVFNLSYPFLIICILLTANYAFIEASNSNFKDIFTTIENKPYLKSSFFIIFTIFLYPIYLLTFGFIEKYKKAKGFIKKLLINIMVFLLTTIIYTILIMPISFSPIFKNVIIKENLCDEIMKNKFKSAENYDLQKMSKDLKRCYKNLN